MNPFEQDRFAKSEVLKTTAAFSENNVDSTGFYSDTGRSEGSDDEGKSIGNYVLQSKLGQGGFGTVWLAEQLQPVRRKVAIKVLKLGMDSREVVARFSQERQALAMMEHPGIAKVLDAGITEQGRPYFVMELVSGDPLTHYCNSNRLNLRDRLELFIQLCTAVHHAHLKGIIHRDLKPSNILVCPSEDGHVVKIIDFGIAKATEGSLTDITMQTQLGQFMGTPAYMSPEQADGLVYDIDMRADVYSLGVVLYELLTGELPFDLRKVSKNYDDLRKLIREQVPQRPSSRIRSFDSARAAKISQNYRSESQRLEVVIRGDLDWIIMKALEKDPALRYDTAQAMAQDIRRHMAKEAVIARPPSMRYLIGRFVARHRISVFAAGLVLLTLLAATLVSTKMYFNEMSARRQADAQSSRSQQMVNILSKMVLAAGPSVAQGRDTALMKDLLAATVKEVEGSLNDQPEIELEIRQLIAKAYGDIGDIDQSLANHLRVVELQRQLFPNNHQQLADALANLSAALDATDRLGDAEVALREAIQVRQKVLPKPMKSIALDRELLAWILERRGDLVNSEIEARQALKDYSGTDPDAQSFRAQALMTLGVSLMKLAKFTEGEAVHREALEIYRKVHDKPHPDTVTAINNLCHMLCEIGSFDDVEKLAEEGLQLERLLDGEPIGICTDAFHKALAQVYVHRRDYEKAIESLKYAITAATQVYGSSHRFTNDKRALLIQIQVDNGQFDEAAITLEEAKQVGGDGQSADNSLVLAEAKLMASRGQYEQARVLARSDLERTQAESLQPSVGQVKAMLLLARIERQLGNTDTANELVADAAEIVKADVNCQSIICQQIAQIREELSQSAM